MELAYTFLANGAELSGDGRFYVLGGGIDGIAVVAVPTAIPTIAAVCAIRFLPSECGQDHRLRVTLTRPDGSDDGLEAFVDLQPTLIPINPEVGPNLKVVFSIRNLQLPQLGSYRFNFCLGEQRIGSLDFQVSAISQDEIAGGDQ